MSFRAKLLLACLPLALAPLALFGLRVRGEVTGRLDAQYAERVAALADVIAAELERESAAVDARLERIARAMAADNRLRRAVLEGGADRAYLLDYAEPAMALGGLDLLRIQDERGRVLSSGHFRNEYDALDPALPAALESVDGRGALVAAPTPAGTMLALARTRRVAVGGRTLTLVGGIAVNAEFLNRMARGTGLDVRLELPGGDGRSIDGGRAVDDHQTPHARTDPSRTAGYTRDVVVRFVDGVAFPGPGTPGDGSRGDRADTVARFVVRASTAPVDALRRDMDRRLAATLAVTGVIAVLLALVVSTRLARPLAELARTAGDLDLDRLDVDFRTGRADEIGALARVLDRMAYRLRIGAARLREAERRATVGEIARQVNHDVRNGLIPIRNVVSHLAQLAREHPDELPAVFLERQHTLESSIAYLHTLAGNYARLSPVRDPRPCDLNAIVREVVRDAAADTPITADLARQLPPVHADPVALRRIVENLALNAVESLEGSDGHVTIETRLERSDDGARVRLVVVDTGRGMGEEERARAFQDFYTTKPHGTGLGLSIVRRLVSDLDARIAVESEPGTGTRITVDFPPGAGRLA